MVELPSKQLELLGLAIDSKTYKSHIQESSLQDQIKSKSNPTGGE